MTFLDHLLSDFKWYRKHIAGKWYCIYYTESAGGLEGVIRHWTREIPIGDNIEFGEEENWN